MLNRLRTYWRRTCVYAAGHIDFAVIFPAAVLLVVIGLILLHV